jgi:hypothetical protein
VRANTRTVRSIGGRPVDLLEADYLAMLPLPPVAPPIGLNQPNPFGPEIGSIMVTSNLPFGRWGETFSDDVVAAANDRPTCASRRSPDHQRNAKLQLTVLLAPSEAVLGLYLHPDPSPSPAPTCPE